MIGWFVIYTKPRQESVAQENLLRQGFETYLPWLRRPRRLRNRRVEVSEPLFTRYLFVRLDPDQRSVAPIRSTIGVTSLVAFGNQLLPVPDAVIHQLRAAEGPDGHVHPPQERPFVSGDIVRIDAGPFESLTGVFLERRGSERARILLEVLGKASAISVPRHHLVAA